MEDQHIVYLALIVASWLSAYLGYLIWEAFKPKDK